MRKAYNILVVRDKKGNLGGMIIKMSERNTVLNSTT
jgi:hypothetical protein